MHYLWGEFNFVDMKYDQKRLDKLKDRLSKLIESEALTIVPDGVRWYLDNYDILFAEGIIKGSDITKKARCYPLTPKINKATYKALRDSVAIATKYRQLWGGITTRPDKFKLAELGGIRAEVKWARD